MKSIPSEDYYEYALKFTPKEKTLQDFFEKWLPDEIIDCHAHVSIIEYLGELEDEIYFRPFSSFPDFDLEKSQEMKKIFYPGKRVRRLRFALPFFGVNHREANKYLLNNCLPLDRVALYGIPDDIEYTIENLRNAQVAALKMYYFYFNPSADKIYQFFPLPVLEEVQYLGIPIILHIPKRLSYAVGEVIQLVQDFPKLIIVLAHLGTYTESLSLLGEAYSILGRRENLYLDTSMVFSGDAIRLALTFFGEDKILYGSDEPLNYLRVRLYKHPILGYRLVSAYPYHWLSTDEYKDYRFLAIETPHAHWQTLLAIQQALGSKRCGNKIKEKIFFENSRMLFSFR